MNAIERLHGRDKTPNQLLDEARADLKSLQERAINPKASFSETQAIKSRIRRIKSKILKLKL